MPIITSLLDTDLYKFKCGYWVWKYRQDTPVTYKLIIRTPGAKLKNFVRLERLIPELDTVRDLCFSDLDIEYLRREGFGEDYLIFLYGLRLPPYTLRVNDDYELTFTGKWSEVIYWETFVMSIISELYCERQSVDERLLERGFSGRLGLKEKIRSLRANPGIQFIDFGTRRRYNREWQEEVIRRLQLFCPG